MGFPRLIFGWLVLGFGVVLVGFFWCLFAWISLQEKIILTNSKLKDQTFKFGLQEITLRKDGNFYFTASRRKSLLNNCI